MGEKRGIFMSHGLLGAHIEVFGRFFDLFPRLGVSLLGVENAGTKIKDFLRNCRYDLHRRLTYHDNRGKQANDAFYALLTLCP